MNGKFSGRTLKASELTAFEVKQMRDGLAQCKAYIAKESRRAADLRPADVTARLESYIAHAAELSAALAA